jgi:hypothetical protein
VKLTATIRTTDTQDISAEADTYVEAKAALEAQMPAGYQILAIREASE